MNTKILKKTYYGSKRYLKKNSATLLSSLGVAGVVATAVSAVNATPKVLVLLEYQDDIKMEKYGKHLTRFEKVIVATPIYTPSIFIGASTIMCIISANAINKHQQAMLTSAYAYLNTSYTEYKNKVKDIFGEDVEQQVREEIAKDKYIKENIPESEENKLFFDQFSGRYFETSLYKLQNAVYQLNRVYALEGETTLNRFYELIDMPITEYGEVLGWSSAFDWDFYGYSWIDIRWNITTMDDGLECYMLSFDIEPTADYLDY